MEKEVIPIIPNAETKTQIIPEIIVEECQDGEGEETQILSSLSTYPNLEQTSVTLENESVTLTEEVTMEEPGADLQIVEEPGTVYVISTVLDEQTGEMINVVTPCEPGMAIDDSVETVSIVTGEGGNIIEVEMQDPDGLEQGQNQNNSFQENMNEHDYGEVIRRNSFGQTPYTTTSAVELSNQPMECEDVSTVNPSFSGGADVKPILIVTTTGSHGILGSQEGHDTDQEPMSTQTTNPETDTVNNLSFAKKKVGSDGKVRNIDLMDLPFSYAGQSFTVQAQKLILNVYDFFKRNKGDVYALDRIGTPQEKAGRCLNISSSVIGKIRKRYKSGRLEVPGKRRAKIKRVLDKVDDTQEQVLRGMLHEMMSKGIATTVPALLAAAREKINFVGSRTSFRRVLHRMGFKYGKQNKKVVIVDADGVPARVSCSSQKPP